MKRLFAFFIFFFCFILISSGVLAIQSEVDTNEYTIDDVMVVLEMATGKQPADLSFDMNDDGKITSLDAHLVLELIDIIDPLVEELSSVISRYDVSSLFSNEKMNWKIAKTDRTILTIALVIQDGKIIELYEGTVKDPSINAFTTEETIRMLLDSQNPKALREAWSNNDIHLEGVGIGNSIRLGFMGFVNWVTGPFS
ncbi:MAG: hypothetical protein QCI00_06300 [Candidatus Thermoplasmatota archaeon]|nr:hypothetical protein [Candidatus Thermoplasmatota archaeon]